MTAPLPKSPQRPTEAELRRKLVAITTRYGPGILDRLGVPDAVCLAAPIVLSPCAVAGCDRLRRGHASGLCPAHEYRRRRGIPLDKPLGKRRSGKDWPCRACGSTNVVNRDDGQGRRCRDCVRRRNAMRPTKTGRRRKRKP